MELDLMSAGGPLRDVQARARQLEHSGLSGMVLTEGGRTAYLAAGAAILATQDISVGTGIAVAFPRSPMVTAQIAWELAEASNGRFHLGLGTQVRAHVERRYSSVFEPPGPRMREYVLSLKAIFRAFMQEEALDFSGDFYRFSLLPKAWSPGPIDHPDVPVHLAATGPWMLQMAGEVADGVHVHPLHSVRYLREVLMPAVAQGAVRAGREPASVRLLVPVFTIVGDSEQERAPWRAMARAKIAFYGSTKAYAHQFDLLGFEGTSARLNDRLRAGDAEGMAELITDEMLEHFAVTSTWDDLATELHRRYADTADRLISYLGETMCVQSPANWEKWSAVAGELAAMTPDA